MIRSKEAARKKVGARFGLLVCSVTMATSLVLGVLPNERAYAEGGVNYIYEAEDAVLTGAIVDNQHAGYTGSGFVDYKPNAPGGSIVWSIPVTSAGEYELEFRYANGATDERSADVIVNEAHVGNLPFGPTGEWSFWQTDSVTAHLIEGDNQISLIATGASGGANIDHLRIVDPNAPAEPVEPEPQELEEVPASALVAGLLSKKLNQSGLLLSSDVPQDQALSQIEFFARINRVMGYTAPELLDRYAPGEKIWGVDKDHWSSYVLAAAQKAGYVKLPKPSQVNPGKSITRKEAALLIASVFIQETMKKGKGNGLLDDKQGMHSSLISSAQSEEAMSQLILHSVYKGQNNLQKTLDQPVTVKEAEWFIAQLSSLGLVKPKPVEIVKAEAVAPELIAVIVGSQFSQFDLSAIELRADAARLSIPGGSSRELHPSRAAVGKNQFGDTVLLYQIRETLQDGVLISSPSGSPASQEVYVRASAEVKDNYNRSMNTQQYVRVEDETKMLQNIPSQLIVAQDGSGDYTTVGAAIEAVPENNTQPVEIAIRDGIYEEVVTVPANKPFVSFVGESAEHTIITYDNYAGREKPTGGTYGTSGSATVFVYANDFKATNLTIRNTFDRNSVETTGTQAVALYARGERMIFDHVRLLGRQDTLYAHSGSQYYVNSYIEGDVDFIFGGARAVFDNCEIVSADRGSSTNNGYITAASTQITQPYGFLFVNSRLVSDAAPGTVYLGRPWHPSGDVNAIGSVLFMNCELGAHIHQEGWTNMSGFLASEARFYEYNNSGPGVEINEHRRQLTAEQAQEYTIANVLGGWNPIAE